MQKHISINTKASQIVLTVDEIDAIVQTRFRYVQPLIEYEGTHRPYISRALAGGWDIGQYINHKH